MSATPKKKLCWNCDGNVPLKVEHCPYCGVYIEQSADFAEEEVVEPHTPPYALSGSGKYNSDVPAPPFASPQKERVSAPASPRLSVSSLAINSEFRRVLLPLAFLLFGSVAVLFGIVLLLFSDNGIFTLKWNGDHWVAYFLAGVFFLVIGWRFLGRLDEKPE